MRSVECLEHASPLLRDLVAAGQSVVVKARGQSMWPLLRDGDRLTVAPVREAVRRGDVVVFVDAGGCCKAHRVLGRSGCGEGTFYRVRGDAEAGPGETVEEARVIGVAVAVERNGRSFRLDTVVARVTALARVALAACWRPFRSRRGVVHEGSANRKGGTGT